MHHPPELFPSPRQIWLDIVVLVVLVFLVVLLDLPVVLVVGVVLAVVVAVAVAVAVAVGIQISEFIILAFPDPTAACRLGLFPKLGEVRGVGLGL